MGDFLVDNIGLIILPYGVSYKQFFQVSSEYLCAISRAGQVVATNPAFEVALGYNLNELQDASFLSLIHPEDQQDTLDYIDALTNATAKGNLRNRCIKQDGSLLPVEWVDLAGIGKIQVIQEEADSILTSFGKDGKRVKRRVTHRLRTKVRLYERLKKKCR